jgi:Flp pilus assembly protein TadD
MGTVGALVVASYAWMAATNETEWSQSTPADEAYNLLVEGFQNGHLSLQKDAPPAFQQLADPYDPAASAPYRAMPSGMHDLSYYRGRLYLYFGVTPALLLFGPWTTLTGHFLFHRTAVAIFCAVGFLASVALLRAMGRRYFADISIAVVAAGALALGLIAGAPILLQRAEVWEVPISCGYALTMLALVAIWRFLHDPGKPGWWLGAAGLAMGLAVGARPSLLFATVILAVPLARTWKPSPQAGSRRPLWGLLAAALLPLVLCGLGLMLYNGLRFASPLEFGQSYQLAGDRQDIARHFSPQYLWFNFCVYFLEPVQWSRHFPFVGEIAAPGLPPGHAPLEDPFGVLTNLPVLWLALAAPLAWRGRPAEERSVLRGFVVAIALLCGICAFVLCLFYGNCSRYEMEFLPPLVLLAVIGILGVERTLASRPGWRLAARIVWGLALTFSVAFSLLASVQRHAEQRYRLGNLLFASNRVPEAIVQYEAALRAQPVFADAATNLGNALLHSGRVPEAIGHYEEALKIKPDALAHYNLGNALSQTGHLREAIPHYEEAVRLKPEYVNAHYNLANVLVQTGQLAEAAVCYREAVRLQPDYAEAHYNLGNVLALLGRNAEATEHYREAVRLKPEIGYGGQ